MSRDKAGLAVSVLLLSAALMEGCGPVEGGAISTGSDVSDHDRATPREREGSFPRLPRPLVAEIVDENTLILRHERDATVHVAFTNRGPGSLEGLRWQEVAWGPEESLVAARGMKTGDSGERTVVRLWDVRYKTSLHTWELPLVDCHRLRFGRTWRRLACLGSNGVMSIWDVASGDSMSTLLHDSEVLQTAWNPDESEVATITANGTLGRWNIGTGKLLVSRAIARETGGKFSTQFFFSWNSPPSGEPYLFALNEALPWPDGVGYWDAETLAPIQLKKPTPEPEKTEQDCRECNGEWGPHGILGHVSCVCATEDGGKPCRYSTECSYRCEIPYETALRLRDVECREDDICTDGLAIPIGECSDDFDHFGCHAQTVRRDVYGGPTRVVFYECVD